MKYKKDYESVGCRKEFVELLLTKYQLKPNTASMTYRKYKKLFGIHSKEDPDRHVKKPHTIMMLNFYDMQRFCREINRNSLKHMGFTESEINWLEDNENFNV